MDKADVAHIDKRILFRHKKEWNLAICDMDGPSIYAMWSMSEKEIPYDFTYLCNVTNKTNKKTHKYKKQTGGCHSRGSWGHGQNRWRG